MSEFNFHEPYKAKKPKPSVFRILIALFFILSLAYTAYFVVDSTQKIKIIDHEIDSLNDKLNDKIVLEQAKEVAELNKTLAQLLVAKVTIQEYNDIFIKSNTYNLKKLNGIVSSLIKKEYLVSLKIVDGNCIILGRVRDPQEVKKVPHYLHNLEKSLKQSEPMITSIKRIKQIDKKDLIEFEIKINLR